MMNKKLVSVLLITLASIFLFQKEERFQEKFAFISIPIKEFYLNIKNGTDDIIEKYITQSNTVDNLKRENVLLRKYLYNQKMTINQLEHYSKSKVKRYENSENVLHIQTLSYKKLNDFSYIYLLEGMQI